MYPHISYMTKFCGFNLYFQLLNNSILVCSAWFYEFQIKSVLENQKQKIHLEKNLWILNGYNSLYNKNNTAFLCSLEIFKKSTCCSTNEDLTELHPDQEGWKKEREREKCWSWHFTVLFSCESLRTDNVDKRQSHVQTLPSLEAG